MTIKIITLSVTKRLPTSVGSILPFTMHRIKAWVRAFFGFSRGETNAFLILLPLVIIILFSEPIYRHWQEGNIPDHSKDERSLDSLVATLSFLKGDSVFAKEKIKRAEVQFFSFDPNTLSEEKFKQLGLSSFLANRIIRYREKGGTFRKADDVGKIYGMDSIWFKKAKPWISIASSTTARPPVRIAEQKSTAAEMIDINTSDSIQLMKIYGIGPSLSKRIQTFRDRLGGFISMDQLKEVYGLDTIVVKELRKRFFVAENFIPQRININTDKLEDVKHPYVKWKEAQAIVAYRKQHGDIKSIDQLIEIKILSHEWIEKVTPYLKIE